MRVSTTGKVWRISVHEALRHKKCNSISRLPEGSGTILENGTGRMYEAEVRKNEVKWCLLDSDRTTTLMNCCLHKNYSAPNLSASQHGVGTHSQAPDLTWRAMGRWKLLGEKDSVFFKGVAPDRSTTLQWMSLFSEYMVTINGHYKLVMIEY